MLKNMKKISCVSKATSDPPLLILTFKKLIKELFAFQSAELSK